MVTIKIFSYKCKLAFDYYGRKYKVGDVITPDVYINLSEIQRENFKQIVTIMEANHEVALKWWDNLPFNVKDELTEKYRNSGIPEFDNTTSEFRAISDWDRWAIVYEKESKDLEPNDLKYPSGD